MMRFVSRVCLVLLISALTGCAIFPSQPGYEITSPASGSPIPAAQVRFIVQPPAGTPPDADLVFVLLDPVSDLEFNTQRFPMQAQQDGNWSVSLTPAVGSLLYYRYERTEPGAAVEVSVQGSPVDYRIAYIPGPGDIHEMIARWSNEPYQGQTGRLLGQINSVGGDQPLSGMLVSVGGHLTFSDGEGRFRVDDLPPGLHSITTSSPTGNYLSRRQEALIAPNTTTPAVFKLEAAEPVVVTFQVTVPPDTPAHSTLRLAGNIAQLGFRFQSSEYGSYQSIPQMPALVRVDPEHFLGVFTLYSGTNLQYKYTLGDGLWNAERDASGAFTTRTVILPAENPTLRDHVASWSETAAEPTVFEVSIPAETPPADQVAIQFKAGRWHNPVPMWLQDGLWTFALFGPESFQQELEYRFCRNLQCGAADEAGFAGNQASGRPLSSEMSGTRIDDTIQEWQWLESSRLQETYPSNPESLTYLQTAGVDLSPSFDPSWSLQVPTAFSALENSGINEIVIAPTWTWVQNNPFPILEFDPTMTPFEHELKQMIDIAGEHGLRVALRPSPNTGGTAEEAWWQQGMRNQLWWELWFEEYRSFILTHARWAQQQGVEKLIIGGPAVIPALPFGTLPDGSPSGVPADSETRWRNLTIELREQFAGQLVFELEVDQSLSPIPPFIELFDHVNLYWHSSIEPVEIAQQDVQLAAIDSQLENVLEQEALEGKNITISLAYLSIEDSAAACPQQPDGSCRPFEDFSRGQIVDIDLEVDLESQAKIYDLFLQAIADEPRIKGVYARGFYPAVILHDKSLSVYGKPAQDVLAAWFQTMETIE